MPLVHLELKLPPVLRTLNPDGELPCTLVGLALSSASATAAFHLANALEEQQQAQGVLVLPLPAADDLAPVSQLFAFGGLSEVSEAMVRACAAECGLEVELVEVGTVRSLNEVYLRLLGERLLGHHLVANGWVPLFGGDTYAKRADLFPAGPTSPPPPLPSTMGEGVSDDEHKGVTDWVEAVKVVGQLNTATTDPWGSRGQLGLTVAMEPIVFKRVHPPWALLQALVARDSREAAAGARKTSASTTTASDGTFLDLCSEGVFPHSEAVLELRTVRPLSDLMGKGFVASLPSPTLELSRLQVMNRRKGWVSEDPVDEASMRRFWRLAHQMELPAGPLQYVRVLMKGQGAATVAFPTCTLVRVFVHNYSRTSTANAALCQTMLELLKAMPGVTRLFCNRTPSPVGGAGKRLTSPPRPGRSLLKTARQLRDEAALEQTEGGRGRGGDEGRGRAGTVMETEKEEEGAGGAKRKKETTTPAALKTKARHGPPKKAAAAASILTPGTPDTLESAPSASPGATNPAALAGSFAQEGEEDDMDSLFSSEPAALPMPPPPKAATKTLKKTKKKTEAGGPTTTTTTTTGSSSSAPPTQKKAVDGDAGAKQLAKKKKTKKAVAVGGASSTTTNE